MKRILSIFAFEAGLILAACTPKEQEIAVTGVKVEPTSVSLEVGETTMLKATVEPADATDKSVTWSSSNVPVAAVQDGTVVAIAPGSATIIVTTVSGGKTATCAVTVKAKGSGEDPNGGEEVKAKGIKLSKSVLTLKAGETSDAIKVTLEPENATDKSFTVVTSDSAVAEVAKTSDSGFTVKGISGGIAEITVTSPDGPTATLVAKVIPAIQEVDLGLPSGVKWASFNIGASAPEDFGCFYAWAETEPKEDYAKGTYKLGEEPFSKYNDTDNKVYLDPEDDAATALYGDGWRTPALAELRELKDKCTWKWTEVNGVKGQTVTGPNGNSIFLPAAGLMNGTDNKFKEIDGVYMVLEKLAGTFNFDSTGAIDRTWDYSIGATVRAVKGNYVKVTSLKLDVTTIENLGPAKAKIRATVQPSNATDKLVEWSTSNKEVATVDQEGNVVILKKGLATISAKCSGFVAGCEIVSAYSWNEPEKVDLGLPSGTLWASFNLGAWQPEEVGAYFAWGETEPKGYFSNSNYKFRNSDKYKPGRTPEILQPEDDAAHVKFGGKWRIPTNIDWRELIDNCTWTYRSNLNNDASGYGYLVTGPNGKSIILPAGGLYDSKVNFPYDVDYWTSTIAGSVAGWMLTAVSDYQTYLRRDKYQGTPIRPVWADPYPTLTKLELDKHSITAKVGSTVQLTATTSPEQLPARQLRWKSNFNTFATVDGNGLVTILMEKPAYITVSSAGEAFTDTCLTISTTSPKRLTSAFLPA